MFREWGFLLGEIWVLLLLVYCVLSAIYAPAIFRGATDVFAIARSANAMDQNNRRPAAFHRVGAVNSFTG